MSRVRIPSLAPFSLPTTHKAERPGYNKKLRLVCPCSGLLPAPLPDARGIQQRQLERHIMKTTQAKVQFAQLPKDYAGLCRILTPRPIHDKVEFQNVTEITDAIAGHKLTPDQEDYFDLLCRLIEDYEKEHVDAPKVTVLEALQHLLDAHGMTAADLA